MVPVEEVGPGRWRVTESVAYPLAAGAAGVVVVPAGYVCDLASVPRLWRWLVSRERLAHAAALHDFILESQAILDPARAVTRAVADAAFYEASRLSGNGRLLSLVAFVAVRLYQTTIIPRT
jgi:hypothetical protein